MASYTLQDVLTDVGSFVNQDPALVASTDLTSQANYINQSQNEWAGASKWKVLRKTYNIPVTYSAASIAAPSNMDADRTFSPIYDMYNNIKYIQIPPEDRYRYTTDTYYYYIAGDQVAGFSININPRMASGASLMLDYMSVPSSLATLDDKVTCPSRPFMAARTIYKILAARSDTRFPTFKAESEEYLSQMIENEVSTPGGMDNVTPSYYEKRNFIIGED